MTGRLDFVDTHCHLQFGDYNLDREEVIASAKNAHVTRLICVGTSVADSKKAIDLAATRGGMWATVGVHPNDADGFSTDSTQLSELKKLLNRPKVVAVGEIGLDYYHDRIPKDVQEKILCAQLEAGLEAGTAFVFHIREAFSGFWPIFDSYTSARRPIKGVIHSFSAPPSQLQEVLKRNLYIGLNGLITYTKDESWRESARQAPARSVLLETDAPFLAPAQFRSQRCEPKHIKDIAEYLADLRSETVDELAQITTANAVKLFGLGEE